MVSDSGNIVNFSRFRKISRDEKKQRDRKEKEAQAAANRVRFGRSGVEKKLARTLAERNAKAHEGLRRETPATEPDGRKPEEPAE
ncbi:MAG: DUF4169 family protein [Parvibaculum sp.]|jgi:hypothetical protein|uniref:DUF4169 family protein n=1 Tax=Parvibaculum sp. TaxID=2024848 RepID=UPI003C76F357